MKKDLIERQGGCLCAVEKFRFKTLNSYIMKKLTQTLVFSLLLSMPSSAILSQTLRDSLNELKLLVKVKETNQFIDDKKERVQFGLSFAYSWMTKDDVKFYKSPSIDPKTRLLTYQQLDKRFVLASTTLTVSPFLHSEWVVSKRTDNKFSFKNAFWFIVENAGLAINVNFLQFSSSNSESSFNTSIEGGIGYTLRLSKNIYFSFSKELKFHKLLRDNFKEGEPVFYNGSEIDDISIIPKDNDNYYFTKSLIHNSSRIIINF